ncbi:MAG TPA: DUF4192 domain-containing protein [Dermatophilaceae bacterium]|nr:DUF4192 domain-containing protein [Dermatophilaceae bacterium]
MTAEPVLPPITCPSSLVASCAPLLGFTPDRSLVAFISGVPQRRSPVILRVDLPAAGDACSAATSTALSIAGTGGIAVDAVAWVDDQVTAVQAELSSSAFVDELLAALDLVGVEVGALLTTNGSVWWAHGCKDPICCPQGARPLDMGTVEAIRAEYVYAGYAPLASREQLAHQIARDDLRAHDVSEALRRRQPPRMTMRWRDAQIRFVASVLMPTVACAQDVVVGLPRQAPVAMTPSASARLYRALADIRVRDVVLHRLAVRDPHCGPCRTETIETLCRVVRAAPGGWAAPSATILALVSWLHGEGALASLAIQRALEEDPEYRLALLARQLMSRGTDPRDWRASLQGLSESECRAPRGR